MIDSSLLKRLLLGTAALLLLSGGAALALGAPPSFVLGLGLGGLLGAAPFASWTFILSRALAQKRGPLLVVLLLAAKLALYGGVLYLFIARQAVQPVGVLIGITAVALLLILGSLLGRPAPLKEAL